MARVVWSEVAAAAATLGTSGANFAVNGTAGTLGGVTGGADGNLTIRINADGKLYVENRTGGVAALFRVHWES